LQQVLASRQRKPESVNARLTDLRSNKP
jgi:hypothetical protein